LFYEYFDNYNTDMYDNRDYITINKDLPSKASDLLVLLYLTFKYNGGRRHFAIHKIYDQNEYLKFRCYEDHLKCFDNYEFKDGFLDECWMLVRQNNLDHEVIGDVIKKIGYKPIENHEEFQNYYLNGPNVKSARNY